MEYKKLTKDYADKSERLVSDLNKLEKITLSSTAQKYQPNNRVYYNGNDGCSCPECGCIVEAFSPLGVAGGVGALIGFSPLK